MSCLLGTCFSCHESSRSHVYQGCDGAHSAVRKSMGFSMVGDSSDAVWGVIDLYPQTNFPAIRKKSIVQSSSGSLLLIPKDGDELVRFYIEFPGCTAADVTFEELKRRARAIFSPYTMEIAEAVWWSAYSVGQRVANNFSKVNRVFLTGDACHTHSPKAGQGMNTSVQDGYNIGWKLGAVLRDRANPALLQTYVLERQRTAQDLIEFDRYFANLFSSAYRKEHGITAEEFSAQFVKSGRYTAGITIKYEASLITNHDSEEDHRLASNVEVGMRLPSAQVVRLSDARTIQLLSALKADSRWHIIIFAGEINSTGASARLQQVCHVTHKARPLRVLVPLACPVSRGCRWGKHGDLGSRSDGTCRLGDNYRGSSRIIRHEGWALMAYSNCLSCSPGQGKKSA